mmetsp:Transcript_13179/g.17910  ORF Transcript_13179/g.17910 Transcript_13179/m.17910 type:complete len:224 (-) Transcript_13179:1754-2425(-)
MRPPELAVPFTGLSCPLGMTTIFWPSGVVMTCPREPSPPPTKGPPEWKFSPVRRLKVESVRRPGFLKPVAAKESVTDYARMSLIRRCWATSSTLGLSASRFLQGLTLRRILPMLRLSASESSMSPNSSSCGKYEFCLLKARDLANSTFSPTNFLTLRLCSVRMRSNSNSCSFLSDSSLRVAILLKLILTRSSASVTCTVLRKLAAKPASFFLLCSMRLFKSSR